MRNLQYTYAPHSLCHVKLVERGHTPISLTDSAGIARQRPTVGAPAGAEPFCFSHCRVSKLADVPSCLEGGDHRINAV